MHVSVIGKNIDTGDALKLHVEQRLASGVGKYFERPGQAQVTFSKEGSGFRCDCSVHLDSGIRLNSSGQAADVYASFEMAAERMEKRVRRYKRRLKNHHSPKREPIESVVAPDYVIAAEEDTAEEAEGTEPVIVAEMTTYVSTLTVGEAVMQMDLADTPALVFKNTAHGGLNVVYRRPDGNIGWIDPAQQSEG